MTDAPMRTIERRLAAGGVILLDGATGTELERRGAEMHGEVWCAAATLTHGGLLRSIHEDYVRAGASVIIANTYASNRLMLEPAGLGAEVERINRRAVEIAREARDRAAGGDVVAVAGSMSHMLPMRHAREAMPSPARAEACFAEMAETLAAAGVDLVIMEMMSNPDLARPAIAAALATGLPVWLGYSAVRGARGEPRPFLRPDLDFAALLRAVPPAQEISVAGVMHTHVDLTAPALASLRDLYDGPALAYPDSGLFEMPHWRFVDIVPPATLARAARGWIEEGVQVVGGCCGLGLAHIEALAEMIAAR